MSKYIQSAQVKPQYNTNSTVSATMASKVKAGVTIPMYFYNIIVPQLGSYYDQYPVNFDNKPVVCCPLHDEDTPSCRYYEETNSFYCFGCQRGGDVVQLHRLFAEKMNGTEVSRDDAIAFLYNYFIKGQETESFINKQQIPKEKLNTESDIIRFNVYRTNLERSISFDKNIRLDIKEKLWNILDNADTLLSLDTIKASDAEKYIKDEVRRLITIDAQTIKMKYNPK